MTTRSFVLAAALLASAALPAAAQDGRFSVGGRLVGAIPTGERFAETADFGFGAGAEARFRVAGPLHLYAGTSITRFNVTQVESIEVDDLALTSQGLEAGVLGRFTPSPSVSPWVRAGVLAHYLKYSGDAIDRLELSGEVDEELGFEGGLGLDVRVTNSLDVTPSLTYRHMSYTDITGADATFSLLALGLGVTFRL